MKKRKLLGVETPVTDRRPEEPEKPAKTKYLSLESTSKFAYGSDDDYAQTPETSGNPPE